MTCSRVLQALGMIAATAKIVLTHGLLSANTVQDRHARTADDSALNETDASRTQKLRQGPFGNTAVPEMSGAQSAVKLRDVSRTTIDASSSHLSTLVGTKDRTLAASFVKSACLTATCACFVGCKCP